MTIELSTLSALAKLREPFAPGHISLLPKPYKKDSPKGKCSECGGWHGLPALHLSYVGHAALTDRLLDVDPLWSWEPLAFDEKGLPLIDAQGGLWIKLTVCGVTRYGYGDAEGKSGPAAMKERIGDALRNAAMRFGAALDLWHKGGELHPEEEDEKPEQPAPEKKKAAPKSKAPAQVGDRPGNTIKNPDDAPLPVDFVTIMQGMTRAASIDSLQRWSGEVKKLQKKPSEDDLKQLREAYRDRDQLLRGICAGIESARFAQREAEPMPSPELALIEHRTLVRMMVDEKAGFTVKEYRDLRPGVTDQREPEALTIEECKQVLDLVLKGYSQEK